MIIVAIAASALLAIGFLFPRVSGWAIFLLIPSLAVNTLVLIPASFMFDVMRASVALFVGIALRRLLEGKIRTVMLTDPLVVLVIVIWGGICLISVGEEFFAYYLTWLYPSYLVALLLPKLLITSSRDFLRAQSFFVWISLMLSVSIIVGFVFGIDVGNLIEMTNPNKEELGIDQRGLYGRPNGLYGNPNYTAFAIVALLPIIGNAIRRKVRFASIAFLFSFLAVLMTQSRMGITLAGLAFLAFLGGGGRNISQMVLAGLGMIGLAIIGPGLFEGVQLIFIETVVPFYSGSESLVWDIPVRLERVFKLLDLYLINPFFGYLVSPRYAYYYLMGTDDVGYFFLYMLSGGIWLTILYSMFAVQAIRLPRVYERWVSSSIKDYASTVSMAGVIALLPLVQTLSERQFYVFFMAYGCLWAMMYVDADNEKQE